MQPELSSLLIVLERERERRDAAMLALREAERRLVQTHVQGRTLLSYRDDTQDRWGTPLGRVTTPPQLHTTRHFLLRLDAALQQHDHEHRRVQAVVQQRRDQLIAAETRVASLNKLVERRRRAHLAQQNRREQKAQDERAQLPRAGGSGIGAHDTLHDHSEVPQA